MYNARTSFIAYRVFLGIKHVSLSYQRRSGVSLIRERWAVVVCLLKMLFGGASFYYTNSLEGLLFEWGTCFMNEGVWNLCRICSEKYRL